MKANWGFSYVIVSAPLKRRSIPKRVDGTGRCYLLLAPSGPPCFYERETPCDPGAEKGMREAMREGRRASNNYTQR